MPTYTVSGRDENNEPAAYEIEAEDEAGAREQAKPLLKEIESVKLEAVADAEITQTILTKDILVRAHFGSHAGAHAFVKTDEIKKRITRTYVYLGLWGGLFLISFSLLLLIFSYSISTDSRYEMQMRASGRYYDMERQERASKGQTFSYIVVGPIALLSTIGGIWALVTLVNLNKAKRNIETMRAIATVTASPLSTAPPPLPVRPVQSTAAAPWQAP